MVKDLDKVNMSDSVKAVGQIFPEKHSLVTSIPFIWDMGVKRLFRGVHELVSPCTDCKARDHLYDNAFNNLRANDSTLPQGKTTLKIADQVKLYEATLD